MKTRTVTVTLEVETDAKLAELRCADNWQFQSTEPSAAEIKQVHVTVIDATKPTGRHNSKR